MKILLVLSAFFALVVAPSLSAKTCQEKYEEDTRKCDEKYGQSDGSLMIYASQCQRGCTDRAEREFDSL